MALSPSSVRDLRGVSGAYVELDAALGALTTIRTGGNAAALVTVEDADATVAVLKVLREHDIPFYCLGAGSDLLVADEGYSGVVLRLGEGCRQTEGLPLRDPPEASVESASEAGECVVTVGAAVMVPRLAAAVAAAGLAGFEFACGIPGTMGGGVATNAGAYGRAFADVLTEVQLAGVEGAEWVPAGGLDWQYRHCSLPHGVMVTAVRLSLRCDRPEDVLERHAKILEMRRCAQPQGVYTFGSTFKNPSGGAAGRLLDAAGLKGERRGGAEISMVHANFVVNLGEASTADVLTLMSHMRERVHETSGVELEPEVRLLGTDFPWKSSAGGARLSPPADG